MKNSILFIALIFCFQITAQRKPKIKGNKSVVDVREELPPFNSIELNDDLEIVLQKASNEGYALTADDNLIDVLKFQVVDSTLVITSFYKITGKKKLDITISYVELVSVTMRDGRINMKDIISTDELYVNTFGPSRLELNASAEIIHINMEGMSSADFNLQSDSLNITLKDRIDARIYTVGDSNSMKMQDNASAKVEGTTETFDVILNGNANLKAEKLDAATVKANLEGSPNARIYAHQNFELTSNGSSKTQFYGPGKIVLIDFLDTSQLHREK